MHTPRYLTDDDVKEIISLRGIRKPCEVAKQYHIGLQRLYKIWSSVPQSAVFRGEPTEYIETRRRYMEKKKEIESEITSLKAEIAELNEQRREAQKTIYDTTEALKIQRSDIIEENNAIRESIKKIIENKEKLTDALQRGVKSYNNLISIAKKMKRHGDKTKLLIAQDNFDKQELFNMEKSFYEEITK